MLKARAGETVIFGLCDENIEPLKNGYPIKFDGEQIKCPGITFVIMHGKNNEDMAQKLIDAGWSLPN